MSAQPFVVILVRHAEPVSPGTAGYGEADRPLTAAGLAVAERLAETLAAEAPVAIYSSPYLRARQTVAPLARLRGLVIEEIADLRERLLSVDALPNWREELRRSWSDFAYAAPGGESGAGAQMRALAALEQIRQRHRIGTVVAASHGNLIALALNAFVPSIGFDFWAAIPMPAVYRIEFAQDRVGVAGSGLSVRSMVQEGVANGVAGIPEVASRSACSTIPASGIPTRK
ncbi:MAG: histidine phosphatase family protein [Candidatus Binataceae bacterium]